MTLKETKDHYNRAAHTNPFTIVRHEWSPEDFDTRTDETVIDLFDFGFNLNTTYLEIGCGLGYTCKMVAPQVKQYIGLDIADNLIELCKLKHARHPNARFYTTEGTNIPLPDESVDVIASEQVFQHIMEDRENGWKYCREYFAEMRRVLRPFGKFCIQLPKFPSYKHGISREMLLTQFTETAITEIDNWYWHVTSGVTRNDKEMWLNVGKFRERDLEIFGSNYKDYRINK